MADQFDVWMEFCESLRPELDSICFYPEKILPYSKSSLMEMLAGIFHETKDSSGISSFAESIAVNVGYLGRFTHLVSERCLTRQGYLILQMQTLDANNPNAIANMMNNAPDTNPLRDTELLLGFSSTLMSFCKLTGFGLNKMIEWNRLIGSESTKAVEQYYEMTKK